LETKRSQRFSKAENVSVCSIDPVLKDKLKKLRFRKATNNAAIIMKVIKESRIIVIDEEYEDCKVDEIREELPDSQPRFLVFSYCYEHDDGRKSYPLCFIFITPQGCNPEQQMMYAGSMKSLVSELGLTKVFEIRNPEDLTEEWLREKLQFFR
jgi:hypothetical protein